MNKKLLIASVLVFLSLNTYAATLQENVGEVLVTNPIIQEKLRNYRITREDLHIAESEYYPTIDLRSSITKNKAGNLNSDVAESDYTNYENSITLTQNLFNGFGTQNRVNYEESRLLAAGYKYIETVNNTVFEMANVYIEVLKANQLLQNARENVKVNFDIYQKVKELFYGGLITESEVKKIESSLSLARSNLIIQRNNALDKEYHYKGVLGRMPDTSSMKVPEFAIKMPTNIERATLYSLKFNPSLLVTKYNLKGSYSLWKQRKKDNYPKVDFILDQKYNTANPQNNGYDSVDDRFSAKILLTYNLYDGGAHRSNIQKHVSMINQEIDIQRDKQRQVIKGLELSWSAYKMIDIRLEDLKNYSWLSDVTLKLYREEYDLGRRTLLELLTAQNDVISSKSKVIEAKYDALMARYRIFDSMGLLVSVLNGLVDKVTSEVNISETKIELDNTVDQLAIRLDIDDDNIPDNIDTCSNSLKGDNIMPYGCIKISRDYDRDGVSDMLDRCPLSEFGEAVNGDGCPLLQKDSIGVINDDKFNIPDLSNSESSIEKVSLDEEDEDTEEDESIKDNTEEENVEEDEYKEGN